MKLGIVADIHEDVAGLANALALLRREGCDQVVVLGDVFDSGERLGETAALLESAGAVGVWGNHEMGLCHEPDEETCSRYAGQGLGFLRTLRPRLELAGCLFTHGLPHWDATDPAVFYTGHRPEEAEGRAAAFAASPCPVSLLGHFHRWLAATEEGLLGWAGGGPLRLEEGRRYLVVVAAVCDGWCATLDAAAGLLVPWKLRPDARTSAP